MTSYTAVYEYFETIQQLIPCLYRDLTFIVIKYILDDLSAELIGLNIRDYHPIMKCNMVCLDALEEYWMQWGVSCQSYEKPRYIVINIDIYYDRWEQPSDSSNTYHSYQFWMTSSEFVERMHYMQMNSWLHEQFRQMYDYPITDSPCHYGDILDRAASEIDFAFVMRVQSITERLK